MMVQAFAGAMLFGIGYVLPTLAMDASAGAIDLIGDTKHVFRLDAG